MKPNTYLLWSEINFIFEYNTIFYNSVKNSYVKIFHNFSNFSVSFDFIATNSTNNLEYLQFHIAKIEKYTT